MKKRRVAAVLLASLFALGTVAPAAFAAPGTPKPNPANHGGPPKVTPGGTHPG